MLGGVVEILTLGGKIKINIPHGTNHDDVKKLANSVNCKR